jgi:hypothetical protein
MHHVRRQAGLQPAALLFALLCLATGCASSASESISDDVGTASIALSAVPADVRCVRISVTGAGRSLSQGFDITTGSNVELTLSNLPLGQLTFTGEAFEKPCAQVSATDTGDWKSEPVTVEEVAGTVARVNLVMKRNGRAVVAVSFEDCDAGAPCGMCGGTLRCDGTCSVATPSNFGQSCGSCGGAVQCDGSCSIATPPNYGQACGACGGTIQCDGSCTAPQVRNTCTGTCCDFDECGRCIQCVPRTGLCP